MPRIACPLAIAIACLLAACGDGTDTTERGDPAAVAATTEALRPPPNSAARANAAVEAAMAAREIREIPAHRHAFVDLDGDGADDLLAFLDDPNWCNDGACTLLVFHREAGDDVLVAEIAPVRPPIAVGDLAAGGWRDILVTVGGAEGVPQGTVALQRDGIGYPEDPTLMAALASDVVPHAEVVID